MLAVSLRHNKVNFDDTERCFLFLHSSMLSMSIVYGLFMGTYFVMQPLIAIELLGAENFPRAMGIYYGITGLGPAISYPFCGKHNTDYF